MSVNAAYNYSFNGLTYLTGITNNLGRSLTLAYSGAHVTAVTDDTGRAVGYGYDGNSNLVGFTDPLGTQTTMAYDGSAGHLTQLFYPSRPSTSSGVEATARNAYDL
jgi:YD repeat-containing protein